MTAMLTSTLEELCGFIPHEGDREDGEPVCPDCPPVPCDGRGTLEWHVPEGSFRGHYRPRRKCRKALPDIRQQRCREGRAS